MLAILTFSEPTLHLSFVKSFACKPTWYVINPCPTIIVDISSRFPDFRLKSHASPPSLNVYPKVDKIQMQTN
jgi:hypothetical protein